MFLDYDGTLSPIVANPDAAYMSDAVSRRTQHSTFHGLPRPEKTKSIISDRYLLPCVLCADEVGGARRGEAVPDGDRQRAVP
jgi:hypothetical protein